MSRCIIISNRLPFKFDEVSKQWVPTAGGLVTALQAVELNMVKVWMGAHSDDALAEKWGHLPPSSEDSTHYIPISIKKSLYDRYYNGFCNDVLWPLLHYQTGLVNFNDAAWYSYQRVNRKFAEAVLKVVRPNDIVWIHDFHLFLLPALLRKKLKNLRIGFFLHVPFPSSEFFRELPVRQEILQGLLGADLVGFHDYAYLQHFCKSLSGIMGIETNFFNVHYNNRVTYFGVFPIGIEAGKLRKRAAKKQVLSLSKQYRQTPFVFLGVDRLDYTKGVDLKIKAFATLLAKHPEYHGKVGLLQLAVPTRQDSLPYIELKKEIEQLISEVNGEFATPEWTPIQYLYTTLSDEALLGLYQMADALLVTSKRDGMNLVVLEYIAAQSPRKPGCVLLSEFTGAISILSQVMAINPWDIEGTATKMAAAIEMPLADRIKANQAMFKYLCEYTSTRWAFSFVKQLQKTASSDIDVSQEIQLTTSFINDFKRKNHLTLKNDIIFMLDYDGTLTPIEKSPELAILNKKTHALLKTLTAQHNIKVVIISGRNAQFLRQQLSGLNIEICAEHGAKYFNPKGQKWQNLVLSDYKTWYNIAEKLMHDYTLRVPESFIEKKQFSITWHYRNSPSRFAAYQALKLTEELEISLANLPAIMMPGKKVIEVCAVEANKGRFLHWYLQESKAAATIIAVGDDQTDEEMFSFIKANGGVAVKVGSGNTQAHYRLATQQEVLPFLKTFISHKSKL